MNVCYSKDNVLYMTRGNKRVDFPTLLIDDDTLVLWGEYDIIQQYYSAVSIGDTAGVLHTKIIELDFLTAEMQAYVINRMMNFTMSGFARNFVKQSENNLGLTWLKNEMKIFTF